MPALHYERSDALARRARRAETWRRAARGGRWVVAVGLAGTLVYLFWAGPERDRRQFRQDAVAALRAAPPPTTSTAGPTEAVWVNDDGSWVVIRYGVNRGGDPAWHHAVALDSGGNWYECREDFGANFGKAVAVPRSGPSDLTVARARLEALGFRPMPP